MVSRLTRRFIVAVILAAGVTASVPWIVYGVALANIHGRPDIPAAMKASAKDLQRLQLSLGTTGLLIVPKLSPWDYALDLIGDRHLVSSPGTMAAWLIARDHNATHLRDRRMLCWHASGAALTIWLTRNWTQDQILARAAQLEEADTTSSDKPAQPTRPTGPRG